MTNFYVSPTGNDNNSGLDANSPFATLERAQEAMRQSGSADTAFLAGGTYFLKQPLVLTAADSGSSFVAAPNQTPMISGGEAVSGWTRGANGIWTAHVNADQVDQLTVNGVRQTESRFPNEDPNDPIRGGWLWGQELPKGADPQRSLAFDPSDFPAGHAPHAGQQITVFSENGYANDRLTIASVNGNVMTFTSDANYDLGPASRYYISEPTPDAAGEWSFDAQTHTISFRAPADFNGAGAVASTEQSLFVINGAHDVTIRGLTMANTAATAGDPNTAAIEVHDSTGLSITDNHFANVGVGVALNGHSSGNIIASNTFNHIWSSAVALMGETSGNRVSNNVIDHANDTFVQFGSIAMHESANNTIDHNSISNVPRFAISEINYDPNIASGGNVIEYNNIQHSGQATPDVGAIYLFSHQDPGAAGDIIRYNQIVDAGGVNTRDGGFVPGNDMSSGIYLDNLASNSQIYGNFVQGTTFSGILIHGGSNNSIHDNVLLDNGKYGISTIGVDGYNITGNETFENLIQVSRDGSNSIDTDQTDPHLIHNNVYYSPTGATPMVADLTLAAFQARGGDIGSMSTSDPGFTNSQAGDFSFTSGSIAQTHGIETLPFASIGSALSGGTPGEIPPITPPSGSVEIPTSPPVNVPTPPVITPPVTPSTPVVTAPTDPDPVPVDPPHRPLGGGHGHHFRFAFQHSDDHLGHWHW